VRPNAYAGIDWGSQAHALCIVDEGGGELASELCPHTEAGICDLIEQMRAADVCRVAIERPDGILVDRVLNAGFTVLPVTSWALKATRPRFKSAPVKSDAFDAFCLAELARTDSHRYKAVRRESDEIKALRALTRLREDLIQEKVAVTNRLRAQLETFWPGPARMFDRRLDTAFGMAFMRRFPSPADAADLDERELEAFARENGHRFRRPVAKHIELLRSAPVASLGPVETQVRQAGVLASVATLELLTSRLSDVESQIPELTYAHPDGAIFVSLFKHTTRFANSAAILLAQIGEDRDRFPSAQALAARAGVSPIARESGTQRMAVFRYACDRRLRGAVQNLADATRRYNPWAYIVYARARERGLTHPHAIRILGRAWVGVIWRCWQDGVPYDPTKHGSLARSASPMASIAPARSRPQALRSV
jgi:transposase